MAGFTSRIFRIPRPKTFLYLMSLRTGAELSTLAVLFNKLSGFYGILALVTGYALSTVQLTMYIYSLLALFLIIWLGPHIRSQSPFECLALANFFLFDTVINGIYTAVFGINWFLVVSSHHRANTTGTGRKGQGEGPEFKNVSSVDVMVGPDQGIPGGKPDAVTAGKSGGATVGHGVLQPESISSILVIVILWMIRLYLVLIVMSYARLVLRKHVSRTSRTRPEMYSGSKSTSMMEDPFARPLPEGKGWRGSLGRGFVSFARNYWLGVQEGDEGAWEDIGMGRLSRGNAEAPGVVERERRRRSGTGPPPPQAVPQLLGNSHHLRVQERREGK